MVRKFSGWALPPMIDDLVGKLLVHFAGQHALDDLQRGVVGIAASLDEVWLEAGRGHGPADGGPAPVDDHGLHADRLHEDDVQQEVPEVLLVLHDAAAQLDHRHLAAELADPVSASMSTSAFLPACSIVGFSLSGGLWGLSPLGACHCQ